jgi:hypothetical protein
MKRLLALWATAVGLLDDVAKINADAKLDPPLSRHASIAFDHAVLQFDRAAHGVDHAAKFVEEPIPGCA